MASMKDYDVLLREKTDSEIRNYFPITKSANVMVATNKTLNDVIKEQEVKNYETYIGLKKLNNIEDFAEVNQNAYSKIKFGFKSVSAKNKTDTLSLAAGNNISIDSDENDNIIISSTYDEVPMASEFESGKMSRSDYIKLQGIESYANNYIHPKSGVVGGLYGYVRVDDNGHVIEGMKEALPVELGGTGVKSYEELEKKLNIPVNIPIDDEITANGKNPVSGAAMYDALKSKANVDHGLHVPSISGETNDGITFLSNNNTWGTVRVATTDKTGVIKLSSDYDDVLDGVVLTPEAVRSGDDKVIKYVDKKFTDLIGNASESLDTIYELAEAAEKHEELLTRVDAAIGQKVDKVEGKGLSTNDYTTEDKNIVNNASSHVSNNNNPHNVTKAQIGLENVTNDKQIKGLSEGTTKDHVVTFGEDGYTVKDSGYSIKSDVPENAKFTDTTYSLSVDVDENKYPLVKFTNSNNDENRFSIYGDDRLKVTKDAFGNIKIDSSGIKYNEASETGSGFMSQADYIKLHGIEEGANKYVHPTSGVVASTYLKVSVDKYGHVISGNNDVIKVSEGGTGANNAKDALVNLGINATTTEINYLSGLMNNVQDQLDYKVGTDVFNKHTHPQYSTTDHTHSEYATSNHSHPQYSITNHTHPQYSITNHTHSEYATSNHTHSEYATSNHTHTQYLSTAGGTLSGDLKFTRYRGIVQYMATPSNYNKLVSWYNEESNTLIGQIGYHNQGESIAIVPYQTTANPWSGRVGLFIYKNHAVLDGKELLTEANYSDYAASKEHTHTQYLSTADISVTNISYTIPANTDAGWRKIARISHENYYFCFDLYATGNWQSQKKSVAHFQISARYTKRVPSIRINQISGYTGEGIARIRIVREDTDIYVLEEYSTKSENIEKFEFIMVGHTGTVEPLNGVIETNDDSVYKNIVTSDVVDIPNGYSINSGNISSQTVSKASSATYADNAAKVNGHTVNSNVPANAKFTDTVYDDTEVKESIEDLNSNLDGLKYSEIAGGKNLFDVSKIDLIDVEYRNGVYTNKTTDSKTFFDAYIDYWNDDGYMRRTPNELFSAYVKGRYRITGKIIEGCTKIRLKHNGSTKDIVFFIAQISYFGLKVGDTFTISIDVHEYNPSNVGGLIVKNIQIEKGTRATEYEQYIPSVKMLAEENARQNDSLSSLGKCKNLLNPTLQTTTQNGVTCTNNGDGTYTLNGTAVSTTYFAVQKMLDFAKKTTNKDYKLVGCPTGGINKYDLRYEINNHIDNGGGKDMGEGVIIKNDKITSTDINAASILIAITKGATLNNLVFKPMLTTNLDATYDDFVPYTGDGDTLTSDVAKINSDLSGKANSSHTHSIANITNLQSTLDGKAASNHTHTQYLSTAGGAISNRITRDSGGSFISDRNRVAVFGTKCTKSNYNPIVGQKTKNGAWTIGNLGGDESLLFNYSTDENFNAGTNQTTAVHLEVPTNTTAPSVIITSATIGSQTVSKASSATYSTSAAYATKASTADYATSASKSSTNFIIKDGNNLLLRTENANFTSGIGYDKKGEECLALWAKSSHTALRWYAGADMSTMTQGTMMDITPDLEITKPNGTDSLVGRIGGSTILTASNQGKVSNNINKYLPINGGVYLFIDGHVSTDSRFTWHEYNVTYATNGLLHCNDDASGPYITNNSGYKLTFEVKIGADGGYTQYGYGTTSGSLPSYQHSGTGRESFAVSNTVTAGQIFKFSVPNGKNFFFGCGGGSIEYIKISEVMMESVNYAPLIIKRTGSTYAAGIKFYNNNGALGSIAMFGTANGGLYRYLGDESNYYLMMDTSNIQSYAIPYETDSNNIFAIKAPSGKDGSFVRVPSSAGGLMPYERGTIGSGHSCLGTESWYFSKAYIDDVYAKSYHTDSTIRYGNAGAQFFSSCASSTSGTKTVAVPKANKWYHILRMNHADNSGYFSELAFPLTDTAGTYNHMAYRTVAASRERTWRTLLDSSNYSSYALPLSGGTLTGGLNINVGSGYPFTINNLSGDSSTEVSMVICSGSTPYWCIGKGVGAIGADLGIWNNRRSHVTLRIRSADDVIVTNYPLYAKYFRLTDNLWSMGVADDSNNMSIYPDTGSRYGLGFYAYSNPTTIIRPQVDNYLYLGHASYRFAEVRSVNMYISAGTAVTSDRRYKNTINELDEELSNNFIMSLKPSSFKYNDGESGRLHYGLIAQDVEDAMKTNNISSQEFAGLIIEKLNEPIERDVLDNDGNIVINEETGEPQKESYLKETGEIKYDLRYEEFIAPMIKVIQKQNREIEDLRNEISELKELITQA